MLIALGVHPHHANAPISNMVAMELLVFLVLAIYFVLVRVSLSVEKPGPVQHVAEFFDGFIKNQSHELIGH